jgi:hypothetical protein
VTVKGLCQGAALCTLLAVARQSMVVSCYRVSRVYSETTAAEYPAQWLLVKSAVGNSATVLYITEQLLELTDWQRPFSDESRETRLVVMAGAPLVS